MRLYRAMLKDEDILSSHVRAFSSDKKKIDNISFSDEIYSHIMPTYKLDGAKSRKVIYSFTDDIDVACMFLKKYSKFYDRIGYIDIDTNEKSSALINGENIFLVKPIFRMWDWIDLVAYNLTQNNLCKTKLTLTNTNYKSCSVPFINALVPSRWGALSLAYTSREYAVICQNLSLNILSKVEIKNECRHKKIEEHNLFLCNIDDEKIINNFKKALIVLKSDIENIQITSNRKKYVIKEFSNCEQYLQNHKNHN